MCKSWCELVFGILVIIFALWETTYSKWILVIIGIVLLIHSFTCKKCFMNDQMMPEKTMASKKRR